VEEARWEASSWRGGGEVGGRRGGAREQPGGVGGVLSGGVRMEERGGNGRIRQEQKKKMNIKGNIIGRKKRSEWHAFLLMTIHF
jgi:hypothetical protein